MSIFNKLGCAAWFLFFFAGAGFICTMIIRFGVDRFIHTYMPY